MVESKDIHTVLVHEVYGVSSAHGIVRHGGVVGGVFVYAPPYARCRVVEPCAVVHDVDAVVGEEFLAGVFVAIDGRVGRLGHGHAVGVVVGRLFEDGLAVGALAHHGADVALIVANVDVHSEAVAVTGRSVEARELPVLVLVGTVGIVGVDYRKATLPRPIEAAERGEVTEAAALLNRAAIEKHRLVRAVRPAQPPTRCRPRERQDAGVVIGARQPVVGIPLHVNATVGIPGHVAVAVVGVLHVEVGKVGEVHGALGDYVAVGVGDFPKI